MRGSQRHVLIIAPDFPPSSYPQALRTRFFVTHLTEFGWRPFVVTVKPEYYEWAVDRENEKLLSPTTEVVRTKATPAALTRRLGIGDLGIRTLWHHWVVAQRICSKNQIQVVFISAPPFVTTILGRFIYDRFRIPYVIDYNDPWLSPYYRKHLKSKTSLKRALSYRLSQILEPFVLRHAGHIVAVSKETVTGALNRCRWLGTQDVTEIPHGGEPLDFDYIHRNRRSNKFFQRDDGLFHIGCVGRGGTDMKPALEAVFQAIRKGLEHSPHLFEKIRLHFVGTTYAPKANGFYQVLPVAKEIGIQNYVQEVPERVSYLDAIQILVDSHALLAVGSDQKHYTASKIFPYILAKKPILAIFREESSVVAILKETKAGKVVTFGEEELSQGDIQEISEHLEEILSLPQDYIPPTSWEAFERYTARAMTERLTKVFDQVVSQ